ncbi:MAG: TonB-dependent receptor [Psychromonas sp.]|nr:TonB-dependent receptor [Psychromonas sp.]
MFRSLRFRFPPFAVVFFALGSASSFAKHKEKQTVPEHHTAKRMNITIAKGYTNLITGDKSRTQTGTAITVLDEKYIKNTQAKTVADLLQIAPGVSVVNSGGLGHQTSVFIRGASSQNTVVVIDGIRMDNKSNAAGGFDFANLLTDGIERIEIIRGAQSALWGSDAIGGVINITSKKGSKGFHPNTSLEYGARHYGKQFVNVNGGANQALYSVSFANMSTDGINSKKDPLSDPDPDGYRNQLINTKVTYQFNDILSLDGVARDTEAKSQFDSDSYVPGKDNNAFVTNKQLTTKLNAHINLFDNHWLNRLSTSYSKNESKTTDPQNTLLYPYTQNQGITTQGEFQSDYLLQTNNFHHRITLVEEIEHINYKPWNGGSPDLKTMNSVAIIGEYGVQWRQKIFINGSIRHDQNSEFDNTNTYKFTFFAWLTKQIRLHNTYSTGVKNPTFSQLDNQMQMSLNSETSKGWDSGIEYNFFQFNSYIDLTYFNSKYNDRIVYIPNTFPARYENQNEKTQGFELSGSSIILKDLSLKGQYTYLDSQDGTAQKNELLRRPKHSASININYKLTTKLSSNFGMTYRGKSIDIGVAPSYANAYIGDYTVFNLAAYYQFTDHFSMKGRIENMLDKDYENARGYATDPLSGYIGVSFK